ncbi:MAG: hypothetical protein MK135_15280 [Polyangiaceae bacterium]|nr:hypothetical protein [Polyangiaceae bacterium]
MKIAVISLALLSATACGSSQDRRVMTPEERLEAELAYANERAGENEENSDQFSAAVSESEEEAQFDRAQAEHELKRATLGAVECPATFEKEQLKDFKPGTATVSVTFANDGRSKDVAISENYQDTSVGNCVLRAYQSVHIKSYTGEEETMTWELKLDFKKEEKKEE